jgi:hypothetical protein
MVRRMSKLIDATAEKTSSILLRNSTIEALKELSNMDNTRTYGKIITDLIHAYRKMLQQQECNLKQSEILEYLRYIQPMERLNEYLERLEELEGLDGQSYDPNGFIARLVQQVIIERRGERNESKS